MSKADVIARISGYDSISDFLAMLRRFASDPECDVPRDFLNAATVVDCLVTEVDRLTTEVNGLTAEVEWLTNTIDDLRKEIINHQEM
jgi:hypothetical protein